MLATAYHCRPSEILQIRDEWAAYQFDVAAYTVGQGALNEAERQAYEKTRRKNGRGAAGAKAEPMPSGVLQSLVSR